MDYSIELPGDIWRIIFSYPDCFIYKCLVAKFIRNACIDDILSRHMSKSIPLNDVLELNPCIMTKYSRNDTIYYNLCDINSRTHMRLSYYNSQFITFTKCKYVENYKFQGDIYYNISTLYTILMKRLNNLVFDLIDEGKISYVKSMIKCHTHGMEPCDRAVYTLCNAITNNSQYVLRSGASKKNSKNRYYTNVQLSHKKFNERGRYDKNNERDFVYTEFQDINEYMTYLLHKPHILTNVLLNVGGKYIDAPNLKITSI